jgi:hypothetical protein
VAGCRGSAFGDGRGGRQCSVPGRRRSSRRATGFCLAAVARPLTLPPGGAAAGDGGGALGWCCWLSRVTLVADFETRAAEVMWRVLASCGGRPATWRGDRRRPRGVGARDWIIHLAVSRASLLTMPGLAFEILTPFQPWLPCRPESPSKPSQRAERAAGIALRPHTPLFHS